MCDAELSSASQPKREFELVENLRFTSQQARSYAYASAGVFYFSVLSPLIRNLRLSVKKQIKQMFTYLIKQDTNKHISLLFEYVKIVMTLK